jgi:hypothetical protein
VTDISADLEGGIVSKLALVLSIIALPLAFTATAAANSTQSHIVTVHQTDPFDDAIAACGFPIDLRQDGSFEIKDFFDNSGTLFKEIDHPHGGSFTLTAINPANGKSTTTQAQTFVNIFYFNPDGSIASASVSGLIYQFVVPGLGTILHSTGRLVFDANGNLVFEAGPHAFRDQDTAAFCSYMADP